MIKKDKTIDVVLSNAARILQSRPWGYLIGTIAKTRTEAFENLMQEYKHNWATLVTHNPDKGYIGKVFPIGCGASLYLDDGKIRIDEKYNETPVQVEYDRRNGKMAKLWLTVNDAMVTDEVLDAIINSLKAERKQPGIKTSLEESFAFQKWILGKMTCDKRNPNAASDFQIYRAGAWYLDNHGRFTIFVEVN